MHPSTRSELIELAKELELQLLQNKVDGEPYRDGKGFRFIIPQLYLFAEESFDCLLAYQRYRHDYPDDIGDPALHLVVSLAYLRENNTTKARQVLYKLIFSNMYFLPHLLRQPCERQQIFHGSNIADHGYIYDVDQRVFSSWKKREIGWAYNIHYSSEYQFLRDQYIGFRKQLKDETEIEKRRAIIDNENTLKNLANAWWP